MLAGAANAARREDEQRTANLRQLASGLFEVIDLTVDLRSREVCRKEALAQLAAGAGVVPLDSSKAIACDQSGRPVRY